MKSVFATAVLAGLAGYAASHPAAAPAAAPVPIPVPVAPPTAPLEERGVGVSVTYPEGTVNGVSLLNIDSFRGIPFAAPPVGNLRLKPPQRTTKVGTIDGSGIGPSCPQMYMSSGSGDALFKLVGDFTNLPLFQTVTGASEDCLTLNVQRPAGTNATSKLPVLFWIYGGGFEFGTNAMYDGVSLLGQAAKINEPFVFVAVNYRMGGFGFLGGKEIKADGAANLGLLDQRAGLEWVADNIAAFGGDPARVTIWGESAGAISCFDHMAMYGGDHTYKGKPLFRGAIMDSGSVIPAEPVDGVKAQAIYDQVVKVGGCSGAADTLACLRGLDYQTFLNAATSVPGIFSYNSLALSYVPRPDGTVLTDSPSVLALNGQYADVPFIIGDQEDEGTLFAIFPTDVTSTDRIVKYLSEYYFFNASQQVVQGLVNTYPTDITAGSPFRTSIFNELYPGFKRLAALLGDMTFTLARRAFLLIDSVNKPATPSWSYLASYDYGVPFLGTFHATDILQTFYGVLPNYASGAIQTYYINFVTTGDPNKGAPVKMQWPQWSAGQKLMNFFPDHAALLPDNFRQQSFEYLVSNMASFFI
ncbi:hypothetical protein HMPREF1624_02629 [Sporothrix schenckii ATCC 58251]|uniref:Carboxylic ester hydrolase n=1 Tax=Sporothrix schenckii (strain ATCC 58251 / de Perez 2211183) TaxID=1391915 RepID=U7Q0N0_SPOS1|nr:hypothetical protein HMPREF1624_02629 [Sporothrix schenckii ATCC 58251]